jgi:hypothetical protein
LLLSSLPIVKIACRTTKLGAALPTNATVELHSVGMYKYVGIVTTGQMNGNVKNIQVQKVASNVSFGCDRVAMIVVRRPRICMPEL